jgi:hypothetical protein
MVIGMTQRHGTTGSLAPSASEASHHPSISWHVSYLGHLFNCASRYHSDVLEPLVKLDLEARMRTAKHIQLCGRLRSALPSTRHDIPGYWQVSVPVTQICLTKREPSRKQRHLADLIDGC